MLGFMRKAEDPAYALLRAVSGAAFSIHGFQKVLGLFGGDPPPFLSQLWFGGCIELSCGLAIALGWRTRLAAFLASGTMAVAYIQFHWKLQMGEMLLPLAHAGHARVRAMGVLAPTVSPYWLGAKPATELTLGTLRHTGVDADISIAPRLIPAAGGSRIQHGFVVYSGGRAAPSGGQTG